MGVSADIQVPEGDVSGLNEAARWHAQLADELESHQQTLVGTSFRLATRWEGVAAEAYTTYSDHVVASYGAAADQAREISRTLTNWARELEADQRRSRALLAEADVKVTQIAQVKAHIDQLRSVQGAASELAPAVARLHALEEDLASLQRQGARIFEDAEALAARHNAYLSNVHVVPPPLLAAPASASTPTPAPAPISAAVPVATVAATAYTPIASTGGGISDPMPNVSVTVPAVVSGPAPARVAAMLRQARALLGLPYVWGGGHGGWGPTPGYDCSGFVSKVLHAAGFLSSPQNTTGIASSPGILNGPGHYVTIFDRTDMGTGQDHVIIDINGHWFESGGQTGAWGGGGGVEAISRPPMSYLETFNRMLHPAGL